MVVEAVQSAPDFQRLRITAVEESVLLDLVADPVPAVEEPVELTLEGVAILVDSAHEILVNKLCTLLERSELRDLLDVRVLLEGGGDLRRALREAPSKDLGFSPLTLAWILRQLPIAALAPASGWSSEESADLERGSRARI